MGFLSNQRFLVIYSAVVTLAFGVTVLCGFAAGPKKTAFDQIDVHRINIVEPDGAVRMVISDKADFPGSFVKGKEIARGDRVATGMIFMDDEGTEMGGLIFGGRKDKDGHVYSNGHLSFDRYMQDQVFSIDAGEDGGKHYSAISMSDRGDYPITEALEAAQRIKQLPEAQRAAEWKKFSETHPGDHTRIAFGRAPDSSAVLRMKDTEGHDRIVLRVGPDGTPVLQFLDAKGNILSQLPEPGAAVNH